MPLAYLYDQLAQRWSTNPQWIEEECSYAWREAGIAFLQAEGEAQHYRSKQQGGAASDGGTDDVVHESFASIRERRMRELNRADHDA